MNILADAVLEQIAQTEPSEDGYYRIPSSSYHQIKGKSVFMHSAEDLCALIGDSRVPWDRVLITDPHHSTSTRSLLATAFEHWDFRGHLDYDERVAAALMLRFEPAELCAYLSHSNPLPISETFIGGGMDQRHCLLERLGLLISSDGALIDAWVDLFFLELKYREKMFANSFFDGVGSLHSVTSRYRKLDIGTRKNSQISMRALVSVMVMAAAFSSEEVRRSMKRYSAASLFELTEGNLTGFLMKGSNMGRNAFIHAMYLLGPVANEGFVPTHVTRKAIVEGPGELGPSLLAVFASSEKPAFGIRLLIGQAAAVDEDLLKQFMRGYLFRWRSDLVESLHQKRNAPLLKALLKPAMIDYMFSEQVFSSCYDRSDIEGIKAQFESLPGDMQKALLDSIFEKVEWQIKQRSPYGLRGMVLFLLGVEGQSQRLGDLFAPKLGKLLKKNVDNGMSSLEFQTALKFLYQGQVITLRDFAQVIPDRSFIDKLVQILKVSREEVVSNLKPRIAEEVIAEDLGL